MSTPLFQFYEKVRVRSDDANLSTINGELAAILGRISDQQGCWSYAVHVYRDGNCWSCNEADLETTGEYDLRSTFYP
jgi:hypothetical protein